MVRKIIETSQEAYHSLDAKQLNERYCKIISALNSLGEATTQEVAAFLKVPHETIWKRFSELASMQMIYRPGNKRLMKSGRNGFTWMLCNPQKVEKQKTETKQEIYHNPAQQELFN
jgi:predicted transcriptional regulator